MGRQKIIGTPSFESDRLNGLVAAFRKRGRAIKFRGCSLEFSQEEDEGLERLNIDCRKIGQPPVQTRISVWSDGIMHFRTCQSAKSGWKFLVEISGNAFQLDDTDLVRVFEESLGLTEQQELLEVWKEVGPEVR